MVCADSVHSQRKLQSNYPHVSQADVQRLYGLTVPPINRMMWSFRTTLPQIFDLQRLTSEVDYRELNKINLADFHANTTSVYYMFNCYMGRTNCRKYWQLKRTLMGTCLTLNTQNAYDSEVKAHDRRRVHRRGRSGSIRSFNDTIVAMVDEMDKLPAADQFKCINFIVGYNKSDNTFGWNGFNNAMTLYGWLIPLTMHVSG